jgi:tRNA-dihydrouridine synthase
MKFYFAPMEGITGYIYRNAQHAYFSGPDKYYSPFISATQNQNLRAKEINDILPENNRVTLVPQLLTNKA